MENFETIKDILSYEPPQLPFNIESIAKSVYDGLCESVNNGEITLIEANILYNNWREDYLE